VDPATTPAVEACPGAGGADALAVVPAGDVTVHAPAPAGVGWTVSAGAAAMQIV
jgi:hypothetical protein